MLEKLKNEQHHNSTKKTYHKIWEKFNKFLIRLDKKPDSWEHRTSLYCTHLVTTLHRQSSTIRSYVSAIKSILKTDGYPWSDSKILLNCITKSCKLKNDRIKIRLPIQLGLLEIFLFELRRKFIEDNQPYLEALYMTAFLLAYYGLLRVGELTKSEHVIKAVNIHQATEYNREKLMIVLYSSKTHGLESRPQQIFIEGKRDRKTRTRDTNRIYCPVYWTKKFIQMRRPIINDTEQFLIFRDGSNVKADHLRKLLRKLLNNLRLDGELYDVHSFRIGRATDLSKQGLSVDSIKRAGRWKSNAVYKYLRNI